MRNFFRNVHFYLAAIFGLFITIICLTGAVLIFENEITNAIIKDKLYVQKDDANILSIEQLMAKASAVIPNDVKITGITIFSDPNKAYQIQISKPRYKNAFYSLFGANSVEKSILPITGIYIWYKKMNKKCVNN